MRVVTFVRVPLKDRPGELQKVAEVLAESSLSVRGLHTERDGVLVLTDDAARAVRALEAAKYEPTPRQVIDVGVVDKRGRLAGILRALAAEHINLVAAFGLADIHGGHLYLQVKDVKAATAALAKAGNSVVA